MASVVVTRSKENRASQQMTAEEREQSMEGAFKLLTHVTEESGNLRKDLRKDILTSVSILRKAVSELQGEIAEKNNKISRLKAKNQSSAPSIQGILIPPSYNRTQRHGMPPVEEWRSYAAVVNGGQIDKKKTFKLIAKSKTKQVLSI